MAVELMTLEDYGASHGRTRQAANKWRTRGILVMQGKLVVVAASDVRMEAHGQGRFAAASSPGNRQQRAGATSAATTQVSVQPGQVADPDGCEALPDESAAEAAERIVAATGAFATKAEAERVKESYLAHLRRLEYDEKVGKVVRAEDVAEIHGQSCARIRTRLLAIPAEQAPRLARITDAAIMNAELSRIITQALVDLSDDAAERATAA